MPFLERNQRRLLPLLGAGLAGVLGWNLRPGPLPAPHPPGPAPAEPGPDPAPPFPPGSPDAEREALARPPASLGDPAPLLLAARHPLPPDLHPPGPPRLHPQRWSELPDPSGRDRDPGRRPPPAPRPRITPDFLIDRGRGWEAWIQGRAHRLQAAPESGPDRPRSLTEARPCHPQPTPPAARPQERP